MSTTVAGALGVGERPPWRQIVKGVMLGLIAVTAAFVPGWLLLEWAGVPLGATDGRDAPLGQWPYPVEGAWSLVADLTLVGLAVVVAATIVASVLRATLRMPVSRGRTALVLGATMPLPLVSSQGLLGVRGVVALALAIFALRRWAVGRVSGTQLGRRSSAVLAMVALAATSVSAAFVVTHPFDPRPQLVTQSGGLLGLLLDNRGHVGATVTGVSLVDPPEPVLSLRPANLPVVATPRGMAFVLLRRPACSSGSYGILLKRLTVHYRLLGRSWMQRVELPTPRSLRCPV